ncbi:hypothetical protein L208DRAFT_1384812 [Tricholoma matsutake]|nr:hypothetical protein L208DRAFT_1384812 [Tricholoma matsutake 945]
MLQARSSSKALQWQTRIYCLSHRPEEALKLHNIDQGMELEWGVDGKESTLGMTKVTLNLPLWKRLFTASENGGYSGGITKLMDRHKLP